MYDAPELPAWVAWEEGSEGTVKLNSCGVKRDIPLELLNFKTLSNCNLITEIILKKLTLNSLF